MYHLITTESRGLKCIRNGLADLGAISLAEIFSKSLLTQTLHGLPTNIIQTWNMWFWVRKKLGNTMFIYEVWNYCSWERGCGISRTSFKQTNKTFHVKGAVPLNPGHNDCWKGPGPGLWTPGLLLAPRALQPVPSGLCIQGFHVLILKVKRWYWWLLVAWSFMCLRF